MCLIRLRALREYLIDFKFLSFCFTYILCSVTLTLMLYSDFFNTNIEVFDHIGILFLKLIVLVFVSYCLIVGVKNITSLDACTVILVVILSMVSLYMRYCSSSEYIENVRGFTNMEVSIENIVNDIEVGEYMVFESNDLNIGKVYVDISKEFDLHIGGRCIVKGKVVEPENYSDFDYKGYLYMKGIYSVMEEPEIYCIEDINLMNVRYLIESRIKENMFEPESSLLVGIILGSKQKFTESFENSIKTSGVSHVISASGYNLSILIIGINRMLFGLSKRSRSIFIISFIWIYAFLSGFSSSIIRAASMTSVIYLSLLLNRSIDPKIAFIYCITILLFLNPLLIYDIGFLLSVLSTFSLLFFLPCLENFNIPKILKENFLPTFSCSLFAIPLTMFVFKQVSLISIIVNFLVLPLIESCMIFGIISVFLNIPFLYVIPYIQLHIFKIVVELFGRIEMMTINGVSICFVLSIYAFLLIFVISMYPITNYEKNYYIKKAIYFSKRKPF